MHLECDHSSVYGAYGFGIGGILGTGGFSVSTTPVAATSTTYSASRVSYSLENDYEFPFQTQAIIAPPLSLPWEVQLFSTVTNAVQNGQWPD